jgi:hypothetical protein
VAWPADHRRGGRHSGQDQPCERAAEAAHELRTPLAILAARIDSLPPGDQVAGMRRDIERMRAMVDQLLMVARLEASAARSEDLVDLVDLTRDVVADYSPLAQDRQLALAPYCDTLLVRGDARLLHSALRNLVENAIRAEPPGGRINITVGPELVVCVIDHGPGVPEEDRERIFEPFWRRRDGHPGGSGPGDRARSGARARWPGSCRGHPRRWRDVPLQLVAPGTDAAIMIANSRDRARRTRDPDAYRSWSHRCRRLPFSPLSP